MITHQLKIIDVLFARIIQGRMPFVLTKAITPENLHYADADILRIHEMDIYGTLTGRIVLMQITHIAPPGRNGLQEGWTVLGFIPYHE